MNKPDIVNLVQDKLVEAGFEISKADAGGIYDVVIGVFEDVLMVPGETLPLGRIGRLELKEVHRKARTARNPHTGEPVEVEAKDTVRLTFKAANGKTSIKVTAAEAYATRGKTKKKVKGKAAKAAPAAKASAKGKKAAAKTAKKTAAKKTAAKKGGKRGRRAKRA